MSINDFMNKIKHKIGLDSMTLICLSVIVLVGLGSFGLGRLSVSNTSNKEFSSGEDIKTSFIKEKTRDSLNIENNLVGNSSVKEKLYVASKNGKLYYTKNCSGAKRILEKNQVWFATSVDAEKVGYSKSSSCK